jgi:radical SAM superfamily enzyme YgiQ (UPF0313 family)
MRIDVVVAPFYLADELSRLLPCLASALIKADLKRYGHSVRVHDLRTLVSTRNRWREYLNSSRSWVMEAPHLRIIDRLRQKFAAGASIESLIELDEGDRQAIVDLSMDLCTSPIDNLRTFEAVHHLMAEESLRFTGSDVVVLSAAIYTNLYSNVLLAFLIKRRNPHVNIIIGGPSVYQSDRLARYLALCGAFDAVGMGDAEPILQPYLDALQQGRDPANLPGIIAHEKWTNPYINVVPTNLSTLATPDFEDLDLQNYLPFALPVHATRGCPFRCRYCSEHRDRFSYMPIDQVVRDIRTLQTRHRTRLFFFCDSLLNGNPKWFHNLCEALAPLDIRWIAYMRGGGKRPMSRDQVEHIARAGCYLMRMGVDSLEPVILKEMARPQNTVGILQEMRQLMDAGVHVDANLITGFPGESRATVVSTISRVTDLTNASDRQFLSGGQRFFERLIESGYRDMPISEVASIIVNIYPFHVRPGSRTYEEPRQDGLEFEYFDPDRFGYPVEEPVAEVIRQIPDAFQSDVPAHEILQRVRVINRSLGQPAAAISKLREMAVSFWLYAACLEPDDVIGPLGATVVLHDAQGRDVLFVPALDRHLPLVGGLRTVMDRLLAGETETFGALLKAGDPVAVRNATAILIVAGLLPRPRPVSDRRHRGDQESPSASEAIEMTVPREMHRDVAANRPSTG